MQSDGQLTTWKQTTPTNLRLPKTLFLLLPLWRRDDARDLIELLRLLIKDHDHDIKESFQALAKVPPGVGDRWGVMAGEVWTANACATLWPEKEIFSGLLAISASSHYFGDKHFVTHLNESPLLITFFPLVQKFLNLKQNDDSCQRSFLLPNIFLLSKIFCCQRFVVVPKHFLLFPKIILVPKDNFGFQR